MMNQNQLESAVMGVGVTLLVIGLHATGGINKDSLDSSWSPHHYYHQEAAAIATQASIDMLLNIRLQVEDDTKFAAFLNLGLEVSAMQPSADAAEVETLISYVIALAA